MTNYKCGSIAFTNIIKYKKFIVGGGERRKTEVSVGKKFQTRKYHLKNKKK
jgi:hypothetical protein